MSKKTDSDKVFTDFVSQDKDWRGVIDNELRCQEAWQKDWGFLIDKSCKKYKQNLLLFQKNNFLFFTFTKTNKNKKYFCNLFLLTYFIFELYLKYLK